MNVLMVQSYTFFLRRPGFLPIFIFAGRIHGYRSNLFLSNYPSFGIRRGRWGFVAMTKFENVANLQQEKNPAH